MKKRNLFIAVLATFLAVLAMSVSAETKVTMFAKDGRSIQIAPSAVEQYKAVGWYEGVVMWAPDERCKVVSPFNVEAEKAVGWSTTPVELKLTKVTEDYGFGNGVLQVYTNPGYHDNYGKSDVKKVFISKGVTEIGKFAFANSTNISRVEISDTVTTIESYAFDGTSIDRIGIPKSVKKLDGYSFDTHALKSYSDSYNKNMTVYCEAGSEAETFAKKYNLKYVYATMIYGLDGRTMMVDDKEKSAYVSSGLWGETPITKMYAADGRTKVVPTSQVEANKAVGWYAEPVVQMWAADGRSKGVPQSQVEANKKVGWYDNKADVMVTMYAKDGRKKEVFKGQVEAEKKVGWYEGVTMYALDGRSKVVSPFKIDAEKAVGWYTEPVTKMYAMDGRTKVVAKSQVEANKAVGWYSTAEEANMAKKRSDPTYGSTVKALEKCKRYVTLAAAAAATLPPSVDLYRMNPTKYAKQLVNMQTTINNIDSWVLEVRKLTVNEKFLSPVYSAAKIDFIVVNPSSTSKIKSYANKVEMLKITYESSCKYYGVTP